MGMLDFLKPTRRQRAALAELAGGGLRGKVHRVNILTGGDTSVVLRFGIEEADRAKFRPGTVLEVRVVSAPPIEWPRAKPGAVLVMDGASRPAKPGELVTISAAPDELTIAPAPLYGRYPCNCGATSGHPHEPDCIWWAQRDQEARQQRYDRLIADACDAAGIPHPLTDADRQSDTMMRIHDRAVEQIAREDEARARAEL